MNAPADGTLSTKPNSTTSEAIVQELTVYDKLNKTKDDVTLRIKENRDQRIDVARRLEKIRASFAERELKMKELENEMFLLKKRDIVEEIVRQKTKEMEMKKKLTDITQEQQICFAKKEELSILLENSSQLTPVEENEEEIEPNFPEGIVNGLYASGRPYQTPSERVAQERILREMLDKLREGHTELKETILQGRRELTRDRFEIEAKLNILREELRVINDDMKWLIQEQFKHRASETRKLAISRTIGTDPYGMTHKESVLKKAVDSGRNAKDAVDMLIKGIEEEALESVIPVLQYNDVDAKNHVEVLDADTDSTEFLMIPIDNNDETADHAYENAVSIQKNIQKNLDRFNARLAKMEKETNWLLQLPVNALWEGVKYRVQMSLDGVHGFEASNALMREYFDYVELRANITEMEGSYSLFLKYTYELHQEILMEAADRVILECCEGFMHLIATTTKSLETTVINVILDMASSHSRAVLDAEDMKGKRKVYLGCMDDMKSEMNRQNDELNSLMHHHSSPSHVDIPTVRLAGDHPPIVMEKHAIEKHLENRSAVYSVNITQPLANGQYPRAKTASLHSRDCDRMVSVVHDAIQAYDDGLSRQTLKELEVHHWENLSLIPAIGGPLMKTRVSGVISFIKILPRPKQKSSLLVMGTQYGQIMIWFVPWIADTMEPILIGVSPKYSVKERCAVVDVKESTVSGTQFISLDALGNIRVWSFNPLPVPDSGGVFSAMSSAMRSLAGDTTSGSGQSKKHTATLFPRAYSEFAPLVPTCIFYMCPVELNIPPTPSALAPSEPESKSALAAVSHTLTALDRIKEQTTPQSFVIPSAICFHPSLTITSRQPSFMVGTNGGDCYKINMDFREASIDTRIVYCPPFVDIEYIHPMNAATPDTVLQAGVGVRKGNKVFRELFHYHKAKIVLFEIVEKLSDTMITLDADGYLALWKYSKDHFAGMGWFVPRSTAKLNLDWQMYLPAAAVAESTRLKNGQHPAIAPHGSLYDSCVQLAVNHLEQLVNACATGKTRKDFPPAIYQLKQLKLWKCSRLHPKVESYLYHPIRYGVVMADVSRAGEQKKINENDENGGFTSFLHGASKKADREPLSTSIIYDDDLMILYEKLVVSVEVEEAVLVEVEVEELVDDMDEIHGTLGSYNGSNVSSAVTLPSVDLAGDLKPTESQTADVKNTEEAATENMKQGESDNTANVKNAEKAATENMKQGESDNTADVKNTEKAATENMKQGESDNTADLKNTEKAATENMKQGGQEIKQVNDTENKESCVIGVAAEIQERSEKRIIGEISSEHESDVHSIVGSSSSSCLAGGVRVHKTSKMVKKMITKIEKRTRSEVRWRSSIVKNVKAASDLISSVMSFDGTEIAFLVSTSSTCPTSTYGNGTDGAITGTNKISYHIVSLHIENLQFRGPVVTFTLDEGEDVVSFSTGPILKETLTRFAYVLTTASYRVFSLGTGQEIRSSANGNMDVTHGKKGEKFPLLASRVCNTFPNFKYHMSALCPLQHMVALASPADERIALYVFRHDSDGTETFDRAPKKEDTSAPAAETTYMKLFNKLMSEYKKFITGDTREVATGRKDVDPDVHIPHKSGSCFNQSLQSLEKLSVHTVLAAENVVTRGDALFSPEMERAEKLRELNQMAGDLLEFSVITPVMHRIEELVVFDQKTKRIRELYNSGDNSPSVPLGVVHPSVWPPPLENF